MDHTDLVRDGWVRKGLLNKRAQGRGKLLRRINFKRRLFVITEDYLLYFEGSDLVSWSGGGRRGGRCSRDERRLQAVRRVRWGSCCGDPRSAGCKTLGHACSPCCFTRRESLRVVLASDLDRVLCC